MSLTLVRVAAEGCLGTRHGSHMPSGRALWVGLYLTILPSPSLTKSNRAVRTSTKTDRRQRHTAEVPGKNMGVGVSAVDVGPLQARDPCPAQAPSCVCFDWRHRPLPIHIITSISGGNKGGWEGLERPSPLTESAHVSGRCC